MPIAGVVQHQGDRSPQSAKAAIFRSRTHMVSADTAASVVMLTRSGVAAFQAPSTL